MTEAMTARPWLIRFPDLDATTVQARDELPETGDELIPGWVVTNTAPLGESKSYDVEIWVAAKQRLRIVRQASDRP
jgi:hypothetical protein